jgi:hypothetical protein
MNNQQLVSWNDYQRFYLGFFAQNLSQLFCSTVSYPCFLRQDYAPVGALLHSSKFWLQQLLLAAGNPEDAQPPPFLRVRLLEYRKNLGRRASLPNTQDS